MVTENMFGDILSDLGAGLIGGMGVAPSADIGDKHALSALPRNGTGLASQGKAKPTAMFLSAAMMLDWLGERHGRSDLVEAGAAIRSAVDRAYLEDGLRPFELEGRNGTRVIAEAVLSKL